MVHLAETRRVIDNRLRDLGHGCHECQRYRHSARLYGERCDRAYSVKANVTPALATPAGFALINPLTAKLWKGPEVPNRFGWENCWWCHSGRGDCRHRRLAGIRQTGKDHASNRQCGYRLCQVGGIPTPESSGGRGDRDPMGGSHPKTRLQGCGEGNRGLRRVPDRRFADIPGRFDPEPAPLAAVLYQPFAAKVRAQPGGCHQPGGKKPGNRPVFIREAEVQGIQPLSIFGAAPITKLSASKKSKARQWCLDGVFR